MKFITEVHFNRKTINDINKVLLTNHHSMFHFSIGLSTLKKFLNKFGNKF